MLVKIDKSGRSFKCASGNLSCVVSLDEITIRGDWRSCHKVLIGGRFYWVVSKRFRIPDMQGVGNLVDAYFAVDLSQPVRRDETKICFLIVEGSPLPRVIRSCFSGGVYVLWEKYYGFLDFSEELNRQDIQTDLDWMDIDRVIKLNGHDIGWKSLDFPSSVYFRGCRNRREIADWNGLYWVVIGHIMRMKVFREVLSSAIQKGELSWLATEMDFRKIVPTGAQIGELCRLCSVDGYVVPATGREAMRIWNSYCRNCCC